MSNEISGVDRLIEEMQELSLSKARRETATTVRKLRSELSAERKLRKAAEKATNGVAKREAAASRKEARLNARDTRDIDALKVREANLVRAEKEVVHFMDQFEAIRADNVETKVTTKTVRSFVSGTKAGRGWYQYPSVNANALSALKRRVRKAERDAA